MGTIAFIIPYRYRGVPIKETAEWCIDPLKAQLRQGDSLIISDQGSPPEKQESLLELGVSVTFDARPPKIWNIARARNRGMLLADEVRVYDYIWPIDADIRVPSGAVGSLREAMDDGKPGLTPLVRDTGLGPTRIRPGSGIAILPFRAVLEAGGWDESFEGYGSEDIDLFYRLGQRIPGWRCRLWTKVEAFFHKPHPPQPDKERLQQANMKRLQKRWG